MWWFILLLVIYFIVAFITVETDWVIPYTDETFEGW